MRAKLQMPTPPSPHPLALGFFSRELRRGLLGPTSSLEADSIDMHFSGSFPAPVVVHMANEDRAGILGIGHPIPVVALGRNDHFEGSVQGNLQLVENQVVGGTTGASPGLARVDLEFDPHGGSHLAPDSVGLAAANRREGVALIRIVPALPQPEVEDPKIGIVGILQDLGLDALRQRAQHVSTPADLLGIISIGGRAPDLLLEFLEGRPENRKGLRQGIEIAVLGTGLRAADGRSEYE